MNGKTVLRQIVMLLETLQEFVDTNPNEVSTLADSALLREAMYADLNPQDRAMPITKLLETVQEFVDTNPNQVSTLADSALLIVAMYADLSHHPGSRAATAG